MVKKSAEPKEMFSVMDVNAILQVAESVREIRSEYPEQNKMKVFRVMEGAFLYTFKVVRGDRLRFVAREPASERMLKDVAEFMKKHDAKPKT
jgi:hypothetical protein